MARRESLTPFVLVIIVLMNAAIAIAASNQGGNFQKDWLDSNEDENDSYNYIIRRSSGANNNGDIIKKNNDNSNEYNVIKANIGADDLISYDEKEDLEPANKDAKSDSKIVHISASSDNSGISTKFKNNNDDDDQEAAAAKSAEEKIKTIAFNSREYRLIGPNQKEVEMKDDVGTKMMIALENLGKEATDVWEQVNTKLDQGWTEFKSMIDGALNSNANNNKKGRQLP